MLKELEAEAEKGKPDTNKMGLVHAVLENLRSRLELRSTRLKWKFPYRDFKADSGSELVDVNRAQRKLSSLKNQTKKDQWEVKEPVGTGGHQHFQHGRGRRENGDTKGIGWQYSWNLYKLVENMNISTQIINSKYDKEISSIMFYNQMFKIQRSWN